MAVKFETTKSLTLTVLGYNIFLVCKGYQEDMDGPPSRVDTMEVYNNGVYESQVNCWNLCGDTMQEIENSYLYHFLRRKGISDKEAIETCIETEKEMMDKIGEMFPA